MNDYTIAIVAFFLFMIVLVLGAGYTESREYDLAKACVAAGNEWVQNDDNVYECRS